MKKNLFGMTGKKIAIVAVFAVILSFFAGCANSTLLVGVWKDSDGDEITLVADNTFKACVPSCGDTTEYAGNYVVFDNTIRFSSVVEDTGEEVSGFISRFSIEGGILYMTWTPDEDTSVLLTLYRTAIPEVKKAEGEGEAPAEATN